MINFQSSPPEAKPLTEDKDYSKIIVINFSQTLPNDYMYNLFGPFNNLEQVTLVKNPRQENLEIAILRFSSEESAQKALSLHNHKIGTRPMNVVRLPRISEKAEYNENLIYPRSGWILIRNLDERTTEEQLKAYFERFGDISQVYITRDGNGKVIIII